MANKGGGSGMWFVQIKCQSSEISDEVLSRRRSTQFFLIELRAKLPITRGVCNFTSSLETGISVTNVSQHDSGYLDYQKTMNVTFVKAVTGHPGNRSYRACSLSGSDGETDSSPTRPVRVSRPRRSHIQQQTYHIPAGLSDTSPNSDNVSNATLTDSEVALARDTTLLAHKSE
ncbi:hypothetical protein V9T40_009701 [Parthenolecanium corni]|uniref:Uncharacterized protein n=1 Tax=Parthenolecanium corni TaxID=536013 RepID=A0AAN9TT06_9HEMI